MKNARKLAEKMHKESSKQHDIDMSNKLIAEFMGVKTITIDRLKSILKQNREDGFISTPQAYTLDELKYDTSWDCLMPVIEKCLVGEAEQSEEISNTTIKNIYEGICNQDISFAYKSVIEFIKNQNN